VFDITISESGIFSVHYDQTDIIYGTDAIYNIVSNDSDYEAEDIQFQLSDEIETNVDCTMQQSSSSSSVIVDDRRVRWKRAQPHNWKRNVIKKMRK